MNDSSTDRIVSGLRSWIAGAAPGARVPSNRRLTEQYGASPVTVQKAMRTLSALGLVESRPGVGTFVRTGRRPHHVDFGWQTGALGPLPARMPATASPQRSTASDAIGLHAGYPSADLLPERLVRAAIARAARTDAAITRAPAAGIAELRGWFAQELASSMPAGLTPPTERDVMVLPGSQSGLGSVFRTLVGPGRPLLVESPTYWGAILAGVQSGVELVPVATGPDGPDPEELDRAFARTGARAFYAQPTYANPIGGRWPADRALAVLEVVRSHGAFLVEDDWARDLAISGEPQPLAANDDDGHVVYLRSLTKSVSPALRVAALIARGPARERLLADRSAESMFVSGLLQAAALEVVLNPGWRTHVRAVRQELRTRRDVLIDALARYAPMIDLGRPPVGGVNLWVRLPDHVDVHRTTRECEARGVIVAPGDDWFPAEPTAPHLRLNFAATHPERFDEAATVIGEVLSQA